MTATITPPDLLICPDCAGEDVDHEPGGNPANPDVVCGCGWAGTLADLVPACDGTCVDTCSG